MPNLNALITALSELDSNKAKATAYGAANALLLNQGPKLAALSTAIVPESGNPNYDYEQALQNAYAARQAIKEAAPSNYMAGEIGASILSPLNKIGSAAALGRILNNAAQAGLYQSGEQGSNLASDKAAAIEAGLLSTGLESIPLVGKALRGISDFAQEAGLGLRGAAMKKAQGKIKNKTILGEGYDLIKSLLKSGEGDSNAIEQANKIFSKAGDRVDSYQKIASDKIKELVKTQTDIASKDITTTFSPGRAFKAAFGTSGKIDRPLANKFKADYEELLLPILTEPNLTVKDLLDFRRDISGKYNQFASGNKAEVFTAAVDDINEAITKALPAAEAKAFKEAGKDAQRLITFNQAVENSKAGKSNLNMPSDLTRSLVTGGPFSLAGYYAGLDPFTATAAGSILGTPSALGAVGKGLEKGLDVAETIGSMAKPFAEGAIRTQTAMEIPQQEQATNIGPGNDAPVDDQQFDSLLQGLGIQAPQPGANPDANFDNLLQNLGITPSVNNAVSGPANGDLPSQQLGLKQDAALSPDRFGGLANYYAALAQAESKMNPRAANPNSSAKGLFQFVDKTANNLGLQDPLDPRASLAAVQQLTSQNRQQFGDNPELLYAGHYLGAPTLSAWQQGQPLDANQQDWVNNFANQALPNFRTQYAAVQQPDSPIMQKFMSLFN